MAISMVREPSEQPNITNIDDIIPFRHAYGNQNGYVKGKGTELAYTINGSNFEIGSGRVVLQGVESDIDANGVTITIDNVATLRYYVVYYLVNLGTNSVSIGTIYDTAGYPTIDTGDDLIENTSGIARLPLFKFTAINGAITNPAKIVVALQYYEERIETHDVAISNITNGITPVSVKKYNGTMAQITEDSNGVLKFGNLIIPQYKLVWSGSKTITTDGVNLSVTLNTNRKHIFCFNGDGLNSKNNFEGWYDNGAFHLQRFMVSFDKYINYTPDCLFLGGKWTYSNNTLTLKYLKGYGYHGSWDNSESINNQPLTAIYEVVQ